MLRIYKAEFSKKVKNIEARTKKLYSYKKNACTLFEYAIRNVFGLLFLYMVPREVDYLQRSRVEPLIWKMRQHQRRSDRVSHPSSS